MEPLKNCRVFHTKFNLKSPRLNFIFANHYQYSIQFRTYSYFQYIHTYKTFKLCMFMYVFGSKINIKTLTRDLEYYSNLHVFVVV